jgi:GAF domain-containing protein
MGVIPPNTSEHVVTAIETNEADGPALRRFAMEKLAEIESYDWCGIYRLEGDTLVLDEFVGAATDHSSIPVGRGVCGTAVAEGRNQIVEDVRERSNYLACSIQTRSEIVVLIRREGVVLGQIDVDGHRVGAFDSTDEQMLERVADRLAARW